MIVEALELLNVRSSTSLRDISIPTDPSTIFEPHNQKIGKFYVA